MPVLWSYRWGSFKRRLYEALSPFGLRLLQKLLLRIALGKRTYRYMCRTLQFDPRLRTAREADIVVRKDGREVRIEADWLKTLYKIVHDTKVPPI